MNKKTIITLIFALHTLPGTLLDSVPEYIKAEAKCQQLYAEFDISSQQKLSEAQAAGQQALALPEGKTIFDLMSKEQIEVLNTRFNETFHVNYTDSMMKAKLSVTPRPLIRRSF